MDTQQNSIQVRRRKELINFYQNHSIIGLDLLIVAHGNNKKRMRLQNIKTGIAINLIIEGDSDKKLLGCLPHFSHLLPVAVELPQCTFGLFLKITFHLWSSKFNPKRNSFQCCIILVGNMLWYDHHVGKNLEIIFGMYFSSFTVHPVCADELCS